ncbi:nucleoside triphosphate pyrophosphohydrolase family protein [Staphylococcus massiliensis]|uniref:nucleoside triphosphate pyrophosphohydrolase family protein n=1 Tax=Staphylococcus massiliensis TaxID=555791 RepID=UPI001EE039E5|nr:nucleoside triphosphate pyrophosphohydrolase family protein [Staphylococcus massiliensis]MCG3411891.1 nucleoside triphosphate pyrophosphohydrolase family protein [Staphylococcus massiliensis]
MNFQDYHNEARRTMDETSTQSEQLLNSGLGLTGEVGEVADMIKKHHFHGHPLVRDAIAKELGDIMWYIAYCAEALDLSMEDIAKMNIAKLKKRYPNGFTQHDSIHRTDD